MRPIHPKSKTEILDAAIPMFAEAGFNGVSMRDIAKKVGLNAASLYHHFQDKHTLYSKAMSFAFARKTEIFSAPLSEDIPPEQRLKKFIAVFCRFVHDDPDFGKLIQREILAGEDLHLRLLAKQIFHEFFTALHSLCRELGTYYDPHLLSISIIGLMAYHYQMALLRQYQPGSQPEHNDPDVVAEHVTRLLLEGIKGARKE